MIWHNIEIKSIMWQHIWVQVWKKKIVLYVSNFSIFFYQLDVTAELYNISARSIIYETPNFLSHLRNFPRSLISDDETVVINETEANAVFYNISLQGLDATLHAYTASLHTVQCLKDSQGIHYKATHTFWFQLSAV